jgi:hypothetical protein
VHNTALFRTIPGQVTEPFNEPAVAAVIRDQLAYRVARMKVAVLAMNAESIKPPREIGKRECSITWHLNIAAQLLPIQAPKIVPYPPDANIKGACSRRFCLLVA